MPENYKEYCRGIYTNTYNTEINRLTTEALAHTRSHELSEQKLNAIETSAQKEAIRIATMKGIKQYPDIEPALLWKAIYETHIYRKSGIDDAETVFKAISADQSWRKSSGHAFEEMIKILGTEALKDSNIEIILQKDLHTLIQNGEIANEPRDISWLKEQIASSIFDLYAVVTTANGKFCYGCIQSKTSVRDRVTRDREPSINAMRSFFWSTAVVLDGGFLALPKFTAMVNGGTAEYRSNGWHGLYVFSKQYTGDRIYPVDLNLELFKKHAIEASHYWLTQRQWFNTEWKAQD